MKHRRPPRANADSSCGRGDEFVAKDREALFSFVSDDVAPVLNDPDPFPEWCRTACVSLLRSLLKKWTESGPQAKDTAALTFLEANHLSSVWEWSRENGPVAEETLGLFKTELDNFFHDGPSMLISSYSDILEGARTGPGSALQADGQSFYAKLGSSPTLTATSQFLYDVYRAYVNLFPTWSAGESLRSGQTETPVTLVDSSKLVFVPKTVATERAICVEPTLNMFLQLGLESVLRRRMAQRWNVDLAVQPDLNRLLAKIGSRDGNFATLDLSSASDRISVRLCKDVLPRWVFDLLMELRVPNTTLSDYGLRVELGMMSTMGNGFTFPMMTVLLSCAVRAVYRYKGIHIVDNPRTTVHGYNVPGNWAVFGDDIIVCREAYDDVVTFLHQLGFQVNVAKSFNTGPFRESCGHDYVSGHDVRGVYLKRLSSRQDIAVAVNLLNDWTFRTGIPLRKSVRYLMEGVNLPFVPYADPIDAGVRVPSSVYAGKIRNQKVCYQAYLVRPKFYRIGDGVIRAPRRGRRWFYNGDMLLLSLLKGELRAGKISVRHNENLYQTRWRVTPYWDYMPTSIWVNPRADWRRWKNAVEDNLLDLSA